MTSKSREEILTQLLGSEQLIIVYGPPGCGKTRYISGILRAVKDFNTCAVTISKRYPDNLKTDEAAFLRLAGGNEQQQYSYHSFLRHFYDKENILFETPLSERAIYILDDFHHLTKPMRLVFDSLVNHLTHAPPEKNQKMIVLISTPPMGILAKTFETCMLAKNYYQFIRTNDGFGGTRFRLSPIEAPQMPINIEPVEPDCEIIYSSNGDYETIETPQRYYRIADLVCERVSQTITAPRDVSFLSSEPGACLVFLPGRSEVSLLCEILQSRLEGQANIVPLVEKNGGHEEYGPLGFASRQQFPRQFHPQTENMSYHVFQKRPDRMTIYLSDDTAESGPYIPNITMIIDSMVIKDENNDTGRIRHHNSRWISQEKLRMRMFRFSTDFTSLFPPDPSHKPERSFVILGSYDFYQTLPKTEPDAYHYFSIEHDVLELLFKSVDPYAIFPEAYHSLVERTMANFARYGLIDGNDLDLEMTRFIREIPLETRTAALLWTVLQDITDPKTMTDRSLVIQKLHIHTAVLATIKCYSGGIVRWPRRGASENFYDYSHECDLVLKEISEKYAGRTSMETIYKIWMDIFASIDPHNYHQLRSYCNENSLLYRRFDMAQALMRKMFCKCVEVKRLDASWVPCQSAPVLSWGDVDVGAVSSLATQAHPSLFTQFSESSPKKEPSSKPSLIEMSREMFRAVKKIYADQSGQYVHTHTGGLSIVIDGRVILNDERFVHDADLVKNKSPIIYALCVTSRVLRKKRPTRSQGNRARSLSATESSSASELPDDIPLGKQITEWESQNSQETDNITTKPTETLPLSRGLEAPATTQPGSLQNFVMINCLSVFHADPDAIERNDQFIDL